MHFKEARGILSPQNGMNIFRGCTHGCIYCDSRSDCYQITHDFEDVQIKSNAPQLLEAALRKKRKKCMISTGAMCDPYIHLEEQLCHTRKCIEIIDKYGFGVAIQTKSSRILRDMDLFKSIHRKAKCVVQLTLTTHNEVLCKIIEPAVSTTKERFAVLEAMRDEGIPTIVWLGPLLPFINDNEENMMGILDYCIRAKVYGIIVWGMGMTLRSGSREYFYRQLDRHFPGMAKKYRQKYGDSYVITSDNSSSLMRLFCETCEAHGIIHDRDELLHYCNSFPDLQMEQLSLW
ncbi:MAG: radical SAM protein [Defluviitaleaceae bacterium]|nr:radical SAM protein [Defluviitaleaceae bacterium]